jgi:hydrogenase small subunit
MATVAERDVVKAGQPPIAETQPSTGPQQLPLGPLKTIHVYWLAGMSCDGCTISVAGATNPGIEGLLAGAVPAMPKVILHHPVLSVEAGADFVKSFRDAWEGNLGAPYVVVYEGSVADERIAQRTGGYFSAMGVEAVADGQGSHPVPTATWLQRLAPGAAATMAIGTCATWGGIPSAEGNPTGAMSVMDFLTKEYRSAFGLPVINIPGCAPQGDNFTETVFAVLLFLQGLGPLPTFDELGRPAWLFRETVHHGCTRAGYYEEGIFAERYGDPQCLVEIGCWGPIVNCNIVARGAINHMGGCMRAGGICIGCTMPGFPDKFSPFYKTPPGAAVSTLAARTVGGVIRRLRRLSNREGNREHRWDVAGEVPSGWAHVQAQTLTDKTVKFFYSKWQHFASKKPGRPPGQEDRFWGADRPGNRTDYVDDSAAREDTHDKR